MFTKNVVEYIYWVTIINPTLIFRNVYSPIYIQIWLHALSIYFFIQYTMLNEISITDTSTHSNSFWNLLIFFIQTWYHKYIQTLRNAYNFVLPYLFTNEFQICFIKSVRTRWKARSQFALLAGTCRNALTAPESYNAYHSLLLSWPYFG